MISTDALILRKSYSALGLGLAVPYVVECYAATYASAVLRSYVQERVMTQGEHIQSLVRWCLLTHGVAF